MNDHAGERASEYSSLIALHLRLAGDLAAAAELLCRAADTSLDAGNSPAARRTLDEAFELWRADGREPTGARRSTRWSRPVCASGDIDAAHRYDEQALRRTATPEDRVRALFLGSWIASEQGDRDRERAFLDTVMPDAERLGGVLLVRVLNQLTRSDIGRGDTECGQGARRTGPHPGRAAPPPGRLPRGARTPRPHRRVGRRSSRRRSATGSTPSPWPSRRATSKARRSLTTTSASVATCSATPAAPPTTTTPRSTTTAGEGPQPSPRAPPPRRA